MRRQLNRRYRPALEMLETRLVPAVTVQQLDLDADGVNDDIRIVGDDQGSILKIIDSGSATSTISIDANGDGDVADAGDTFRFFNPTGAVLDIRLGRGNDKISYDLDGNVNASTRSLLVKLGQGDDIFSFSGNGHAIGGSNVRFDISGGNGADIIQSGFASISGSGLVFRNSGGAGDDTISLGVTANIDFGTEAAFDFDLGLGKNTLAVELEGVGFEDDAQATINIIGGDDAEHRDDVDIFLHEDVGNGTLASRLSITAELFAGDDLFGTRFDGDSVLVDDNSNLAITANGGDGDDRLVAETVGIGSMLIDPAALLDVELSGGNGRDTVVADLDAEFAEGNLRLRLDGEAGNDLMFAELGLVGDGALNAKLDGGLDNDKMGFVLVPGNANILKALMDGGDGNDKRSLRDTTDNIALANFEGTVPEIDVF